MSREPEAAALKNLRTRVAKPGAPSREPGETRLRTEEPVELGEGRRTTTVRYPAERPRRVLLVLAHGAGAGQKHPFMVAVAQGLAARGIDVVTFDFPYMHAKRGGPDNPAVLEACFRSVIDVVRADRALRSHELFIGGKSMGGRMATHLGAQEVDGLRGIVVFGYPLHPPGQPDKLRVAHFDAIRPSMLIVQGERDAFGSPSDLAPHVRRIPGEVTVHPIIGADHSLAVRGKRGPEVFESMLGVVDDWIRGRHR